MSWHRNIASIGATFLLVSMATLVSCGNGSDSTQDTDSTEVDTSLPDTLRVVTLYSPSSYFVYQDLELGYDYTLIKDFAKAKELQLKLEVAPSLSKAVAMLDSGMVDVIAYNVPITAQYNTIRPCGPVNNTTQVLVQPTKGNESPITNVTELVGRDVYVERDSKYLSRLEHLNNEIGGGIKIHTVNRDTLIAEDLIEMVANGQIPLTVVDSDIAQINKTYYPGLDISVEVSLAQRSAWGVAKNRWWIGDSIDEWMLQEKPSKQNALLLKRYFEQSKAFPNIYTFRFSKGHISKYDALFKKHARNIDYDWRLLAALAFVESRYDKDVVSWVGARGIMQVMPSVGQIYGVEPDQLVDPETCIRVAVKILQSLDNALLDKVPDKKERLKFVIAAYNSGIGHILDAISIAEYTGRDPEKWDGNVADALLLKSHPEYYNNHDICHSGYFRGKQTMTFVQSVNQFYERAKAATR